MAPERPDEPANTPEIRPGQTKVVVSVIGKPYVRGNRQLSNLRISTAPRDRVDARPSLFSELADPPADIDEPRVEQAVAAGPKPAPRPAVEQAPHSTGGSQNTARSTRRRWPLFAALLAFALSVAVPIAIKAHSASDAHARAQKSAAAGAKPAAAGGAPVASASKSVPTAQPPTAQSAMLSWVRSNLAHSAVIAGDPASVIQLQGAGFAQAVTFAALSGQPIQTVDYVVDAGGSTAPDVLRTRLLNTSQPLAAFDAAATVTVREVFPEGLAAVAARQADDKAARQQGGTELSANPRVVTDDAVRTLLSTGGLDLRVQNVLNLLSSTGSIYVTEPTIVTAERQIGQPVRSVLVTTDDAVAMQQTLASMISPFRPDSTVEVSQRKLRLTWSPAIAPVLTVGG